MNEEEMEGGREGGREEGIGREDLRQVLMTLSIILVPLYF